jgi:predicted AAA+ superfamily ATPase
VNSREYLPRYATSLLREALDVSPVVVLMGARQTGKSTLVLHDLLAWADGQIPRPEVLFWRTSTDLEVDFVIEHRAGLLPVEVKSSRQVRRDDARGLAAFRDEYPDLCLGGLLLYDGEAVQWLSDRVLAVPWQRVL